MRSADRAVTRATTDRAVQDDVIRALADASYRASPEWRERQLADPDRVERYARFLARHFYFERVVQFFKYSRALAVVTGRWPEAALQGPPFEALLPAVVLGSRASAAAVARMVVTHLAPSQETASVPYLPDLLRYEEAMMVAEAGPRVWRDSDGVEGGSGEQNRPALVAGTVLLELKFDLPAVLPRLLQPWTDVPQPPARPTKLLVARSPYGRVAVARGNDRLAAVIDLADGTRTVAEVAAGAGLEVAAAHETLRGLVELGAVRFSTGS